MLRSVYAVFHLGKIKSISSCFVHPCSQCCVSDVQLSVRGIIQKRWYDLGGFFLYKR